MLNYPPIFVKFAQAGSFKNTQDFPSKKILFGAIPAQPFSKFFQHSASATAEFRLRQFLFSNEHHQNLHSIWISD
jgi:hypothetical protein